MFHNSLVKLVPVILVSLWFIGDISIVFIEITNQLSHDVWGVPPCKDWTTHLNSVENPSLSIESWLVLNGIPLLDCEIIPNI